MQPIVDIKTIQYILAIERTGCFQKAADSLYISQPALSQYMKRIEDRLGIQLYERDKGRCIPTKACKVLLEQGRKLLESYTTMMQEVEYAANIHDITIGWPTGYTVRCFNKLHSYMSTHSTAKVHVVEDSVEELTSQLLQGDLDLIFVPAVYEHSNIQYKTVQHEEFLLAVPKGHQANDIIQAHQSSPYAELCYLQNMPFILIEAKAYTEFFYPLFQEFNGTPNILFTCKDWERGLMLCEQGTCLALLPYWYAETHQEHLNFYKIKTQYRNYRVFACATRKSAVLLPEANDIISYMMLNYGDLYAGQPVSPDVLSLNYKF